MDLGFGIGETRRWGKIKEAKKKIEISRGGLMVREGENARLCMGGEEVRSGKSHGTCGQSLHVQRRF